MPQPVNPALRSGSSIVQQSTNASLNQWTGTAPWPSYTFPNYQVWTYPAIRDTYANEVTVELGEFDATLIFRRKDAAGRVGAEVSRVTIPKPLGEAMAKQFAKKGRR